jgi:hypothetical protein
MKPAAIKLVVVIWIQLVQPPASCSPMMSAGSTSPAPGLDPPTSPPAPARRVDTLGLARFTTLSCCQNSSRVGTFHHVITVVRHSTKIDVTASMSKCGSM